MIGNTRLHSRRNAERLMYAAEVEKGHVEIDGGFQMFQGLAEAETQPREAAQMRADAQDSRVQCGW